MILFPSPGMDCDEENISGVPPVPRPGDDESQSAAVNALILNYYKKFGRKRDLEQYFSLSTAQNDIRDPSFWMKMKNDHESSDSGERSDKKSESSQELCRISIRCSVTDPCTSQEDEPKTKTESVSPPIIIEEVSQDSRQNSEDDAMKSDDNHSQKSMDAYLDTSTNKPLSPSSSITSQRKLEWDSLADVGYANESDRKTSASSLSTLERLALKQQFSNNDTQSNIGPPTAHSTPLDDNETRSKGKKGVGKKSTKIYKRDVDLVEVNVPHSSNNNPSQSINVNLTKHISFNVEKDGKVSVGNMQKDISISPEKGPIETMYIKERLDKEIQTSLIKTKDTNVSSGIPDNVAAQSQKIPILISLNTLRKRTRRNKFRMARRKLKKKRRAEKENTLGQERSGEQLSEAESFEYMPGHMYNQNQMTANERLPSNIAGNKSSLESSAGPTTDSSKGSKHSFSKDLEKSIDLLKKALENRCDDAELKRKLIKQVCQRLLKSQYRDDDSTTDFLSGLSFSSKKLDLDQRNQTTTSTSDGNNSAEKTTRPKKSILRSNKFNPGSIASTSQSAPNLPAASKSENPVTSKLTKIFTSSNTDSDMSSKEKNSSDNVYSKTSSDALYQKYLQAVKREEAYKRHLKDKEMFLKQKLVCSDSAFQVPMRAEVKPNNRLKDLINDLTRNNYDDGSGDASKLEGGPGSNRDFDRYLPIRNQHSHSVFTLSSGNSEGQKKPNLKKRLQCDLKELPKPGPTTDSHYCCCPFHSGAAKIGVTDSSVQVNIRNPCTDDNCLGRRKISAGSQQSIDFPLNVGNTIKDDKFMCHCNKAQNVGSNVLIHKCERVPSAVDTREACNEYKSRPCNNLTCPSTSRGLCKEKCYNIHSNNSQLKKVAKSSQTNMLLKMLCRKSSDHSMPSSLDRKSCQGEKTINQDQDPMHSRRVSVIFETTRCIQTEISIDPRIAEPSVSDINILPECECVKVISEHCRKPSKSSITDIFIPLTDAETCTNSDSIKSSGTSNQNKDIDFLDDNNFNDKDKEHNTDNQSFKTHSKTNSGNITIPIQGTNMTLRVTIGSERNAVITTTAEKVSECIGTDTVKVIEQATCLTEECSRGGQTDTRLIDHNSNCTVNTFPKFEPKACVIPDPNLYSEQKSCLQSHGINNVINVSNIPADLCIKKDAETQETMAIETQTSDNKIEISKCKCGCSNAGTCNENCFYFKHNSESCIQSQQCSCGCSNSESTCKGRCKENTNINSNKGSFVKRSKDSQCNTDTPRNKDTEFIKSTNNEICICGCGGDKDNCLQNCVNSNITEVQCRKRSLDKNACAQADLFGMKDDNKCSCGCEGIEGNCQKNCNQSTGSLREQCVKGSLEKKSCTKEGSLEQPTDKCPCGCAGWKDNCLEDCIVHNLTPREQTQGTTLEKKPSILHIKDLSRNIDEPCCCGCGGTKDNCEKSCIYKETDKKECGTQSHNRNTCAQASQSDECNCGCGGTRDKCLKDCIEYDLPSTKLVDRATLTEQEILNIQFDKCACGCGNTMNDCKNDCAKRGTNIPLECDKKEVGTQKDLSKTKRVLQCDSEKTHVISQKRPEYPSSSSRDLFVPSKSVVGSEKIDSRGEQTDGTVSDKNVKSSSEAEQTDPGSDPILNLIQDITKRYTKKDIEKNKRQKCFKEIVLALNYLLETDDCIEGGGKTFQSSTPDDCDVNRKKIVDKPICERLPKKFVDKAVQLPRKPSKNRTCITESSEIPTSTDIPCTSSDSATCKVLNKIKKECEKYHQKRCKIHCGKKCDASSSTSVNCDQCRRVHHCACRSHKCKGHKKSNEKLPKSPVAYNLILQTSESMISEGPACDDRNRQLKSIIVKVPKKKPVENIPFRELASKFEKNMPCSSPRNVKTCRSRSLPNESEISSMDEIMKKTQGCTVREYLERNRPDFVERCGQRQDCLKYISESRAEDPCAPSLKMVVLHTPTCVECPNTLYRGVPMTRNQCFDPGVIMLQTGVARIGEICASERAVQRKLLSMYLAQLPDVTSLDGEELRRLASELGRRLRKKQPAPKFISEREMKKHSEKIYKSLPEVVQKKEERKKENIKKTNLLMANMFKKNLQKKTLRGSVNLSNYSTVITM